MVLKFLVLHRVVRPLLKTSIVHSVQFSESTEGFSCLLRSYLYRGANKFLARPTSRCILFDGENISFDAILVIYIYIYK